MLTLIVLADAVPSQPVAATPWPSILAASLSATAAIASSLCAWLVYKREQERDQVKATVNVWPLVEVPCEQELPLRTYLAVCITNMSRFPVFVKGIRLGVGGDGYLIPTDLIALDNGRPYRQLQSRESYNVRFDEHLPRNERYGQIQRVVVDLTSGESFEDSGAELQRTLGDVAEDHRKRWGNKP